MDHIKKYLSAAAGSASQYTERQGKHSRGPAVPYKITSEQDQPEALTKRSSPEKSRVGHEQRAQRPTHVQADNHDDALHNVHEGGRSERAERGLQGKLNNVSRGASVTLLHTNVCERAALEDELQRVLR